MKLSISNIAWLEECDSIVYNLMKKYNFNGLEIAPTRVFPKMPYQSLDLAKKWYMDLICTYGFEISSVQSIWYGKTENLFYNKNERQRLSNYTMQAIDFASIFKSHNLVFGCPKNRNIPDGMDKSTAWNIAVSFFNEIGEYAYSKGTVIGIEANPPIYGTNFITNTISALNLIQDVNSRGIKLNLDIGTVVWNKESIECLAKYISYINHIHISEPELMFIKKRKIHQELSELLHFNKYCGWVSIEMGLQKKISVIEAAMIYVKEIFG